MSNDIPCRMHNQPLCSICCRRSNQCDFGTCQRKATTTAAYRDAVTNEVVELRPCCVKHSRYMGGVIR